jgi:hypothetical protein
MTSLVLFMVNYRTFRRTLPFLLIRRVLLNGPTVIIMVTFEVNIRQNTLKL